MSSELVQDTELELRQIQDLLARHEALLEAPPPSEDPVRTMALAALLHSYYTGIENVFRRIAAPCDGGLPSGPSWHRQPLDSMAMRTPEGPAVISNGTRDQIGRAHV